MDCFDISKLLSIQQRFFTSENFTTNTLISLENNNLINRETSDILHIPKIQRRSLTIHKVSRKFSCEHIYTTMLVISVMGGRSYIPAEQESSRAVY